MLTWRCLLVCALLCFSRTTRAQTVFSAPTWYAIDTTIENKKNLGSLLFLLSELEQKAMAEGDHFNYARCLNYKIRVNDLRTEDTLYFKNSAFLDTLLLQKQLPAATQYALHIMMARRILFFIARYNRFNQKLYERKDLVLNYAALTKNELDSIAMQHFEAAKLLANKINLVSVDDALWLSPDPLQFLFKPGLFDIAIATQIHTIALVNTYGALTKDVQRDWLGLSQEDFITRLDTTTGKQSLVILQLYEEWLLARKQNPAAYYFIETLVRKYFYGIVRSGYTDAEKVYEQYLRQLLRSPYNTVKAHAVYQLCLLLNNEGNKYFPGNEFGYRGYDFSAYGKYDTANRFAPAKALSLFNGHKQMLDSFFYLKNILLQMEEKIRDTDLEFSMETNNMPGQPILGELKFKNAQQVFYTIKKNAGRERLLTYNKREDIADLLLLPTVTTGSIALPVTSDFNYHNTYVKLEALPPGHYRLLFSDKPFVDTVVKIRSVSFVVTNIAVVNNNERVYVLNRKTGMPLTGAKLRAGYVKETTQQNGTRVKEYLSRDYEVNKNGYVVIHDADYTNLEIRYGNDSIAERISIDDREDAEDVYSKDDYDDLLEFYDEYAKAYVYTDRSIYRPGQTVYYKAIFITKNPKTGEPMLMSKENLKGKLFGSVYKKWLKEFKPWLIVTDPFKKELDSLKIVPNAFGSVSGSFTIPKTAATGDWEIGPDDIEMDWQYGKFKVEEYKRPSYEISIDKPKKELRIKDDVSFKVKVKSFAGVMLNQVKINYTVKRDGLLPVFDKLQQQMMNRDIAVTVAQATGYTNEAGELEITVIDSLLKQQELADSVKWNVSYRIHAEAVDATGESFEESATINIASQPVNIRFPLPDKLNRAELPTLLPAAEDRNAGAVKKNIRIRFYKTAVTEKLYTDRKLTRADEWLYDKEILQQWFPQVEMYIGKAEAEQKILVWEITVNTALKEKITLPASLFVAGNYVAEAVCEENGKILGELSKRFAVFDPVEKKLPEQTWDFSRLAYNSVNAGDTVKYYFGNSAADVFSIFHVAYYSGKKKKTLIHDFKEQLDGKGLQSYTLKIPEAAIGELKFTQVFIINNQLFKQEETVFINSKKTVDEPEIIIEKYRKNLTPGSKETFAVSIKTKDENVAAELMTTLYDASLDKLEKHSWKAPGQGRGSYISNNWTRNIVSSVSSRHNSIYQKEEVFLQPVQPAYAPLWWLNPLDYAYKEVIGSRNLSERSRRGGDFAFDAFNGNVNNELAGRVAGVNLSSTAGLENVIVTVGYGINRTARSTTSNTIMIRGQSSLTSYSQTLIIIDGVIYEGDLSKIDPNSITQGLVLKGAEGSAIYGSRASAGVLVLSTKGDIVFPAEPEPVIVPRKNFNESAFFFPAVHAGRDGYYSFSFTMPETVTEWNWKMLAHTKLGSFVYAERKLHTQLPLMVQPNMPRLLYQGDRIMLQSRISNTDSLPVSGKITCTIEDVVTGEDITGKLVAINRHEFALNKKENRSAAFEIKIPAQQLNPIKIVVKISSANITDGEEHIIPVLSPKIFVRQNQPFSFQQQADTVVQTAPIPAGTEVYGMAVTVDPKPQAALLYALPWLAGYTYGCAEQTFNKLLANATALKLMQTDTMAQRSFSAAKAFVDLDKTKLANLPDELNEETMPWLNHTNQSALLKNQLFTILDSSKTLPVIQALLQKIYAFQNEDGGISWFNGGKSNFYISCYLLRGFGQMNTDNLYVPGYAAQHAFTGKLTSYADHEFARLLNMGKAERPGLLYYLYSRSYWQKQNPVNDSMLQQVQGYLLEEWKEADTKNLYDQSLLIMASMRFANGNQELVARSLGQLNSIRQLAITDEQNGMRWKALSDADDLETSTEETIVLIAEAFKQAGGDDMIRAGITKWLLTAKNEHHWSSTKATASAINMLYTHNGSAMGETQTITAKVAEKNMTVTNDLLSGTGYDFVKPAVIPSFVKLKKQTAAAAGSLVYYYFTSDSALQGLNKEIQLEKKMYRWNEELRTWNLIQLNTVLKIADKIKVILTIQSSGSLPFVFIGDKRAAAFEPADNSSGYQYASGMSYYRSVRDVGYQFFAEHIPAGKHDIVYEVKVAQEGSFTSGPAVLQCMYKPEVAAYSNSTKIVTER